jgi:uncharacterized protein YceK
MIAHRTLLACLLLPLTLGGCTSMSTSALSAQGGIQPATEAGAPDEMQLDEQWIQRWHAQAPQQEQEQVRKAAAAMLDGIRLYENGDFMDAIARLGEPEIRSAPGPIRVEALKYIAFSYCVTRDLVDCRHAFDTALGIDPGFALGRGEGGHPMWGPVFEQAKAASDKAHTRASLSHARERWRGQDLWRPW